MSRRTDGTTESATAPSVRRLPSTPLAAVLFVLTLLSIALATAFGAETIPVGDVWHTVVGRMTGAELDSAHAVIIWDLRLPRSVLAALVGAGLALAGALRDKLRACQELEDSLAQPGQQVSADDWRQRWAALLPAGAEVDAVLDARFEAALNALEGDRAAYARLLEANRATLLQELLRQEVAAGIDSGAEFARERLKLQVEALQSSLKAGDKHGNKGDRSGGLRQLYALPALVDERTALRVEQLVMRTVREGK